MCLLSCIPNFIVIGHLVRQKKIFDVLIIYVHDGYLSYLLTPPNNRWWIYMKLGFSRQRDCGEDVWTFWFEQYFILDIENMTYGQETSTALIDKSDLGQR